MTFTGILCWKPDDVPEVIVSDAVTPSDAVFLATHTPIDLMRREFGDAGTPQRCSEEDLLQDFLRDDVDMLLLPITGASGRGKSHLVRWLQARLPRSERQRVVYIPKYQTTLRGVIEQILSGMEGEAAASLRLQLSKAADNVDERTAPDRLLDALAIRIGLLSQNPATTKELQIRRHAAQHLPTLLREDLFREVWLAEHGVIRRFVNEALRGREQADRDEPFAFAVEDLPRSVASVKQASDRARNFYSHLIANADLQRACVELLNETLAPSIAEVVGLKSGDLQRILLELRRVLLKQNKELVILIEDFAILQGVQRELLEAIVEAPVRSGERVLCNIRVAMAVTSGYFASLDTVLTRAKFKGYIYNLDVAHSHAGEVRSDVLEFVGRYLNAARLGRNRLDHVYADAARETRARGAWVPNACASCAHRDDCHDAFGATPQGWGTYPFNTLALHRMLRARSGDDFDPREILGAVLSYTLQTHAEDIREKRFPNKEYAEKYVSDRVDAVSGSLEAAVAKDKKDGQRRLPLLVFWGGNPRDVVNLAAGIHTAFAIPQLAAAAKVTATTTATPPSPTPTPQETDPQKIALDQAIDRIDRWRGGTYTLDQELRRDLAAHLAEAIDKRIEWNDFCCPKLLPRDFEFSARSVRFEAAAGEAASVPQVSIRITRNLENARALQAVVLFRHYRHWKFDGGATYLRALSRSLDQWALEIRRQYEIGDAEALVRSLVAEAAFGARVLGEARSRGDRNADLLSAALERGPDPQKVSVSADTAWLELRALVVRGTVKTDPTRIDLLERLMFMVARSQTTGSPQAVDVAALMPAIREIKKTWRPASPAENSPAWLQRYFERVDARIDAAVEDERTRLRSWERRIRSQFAEASSAKAFKEAVVEAVEQVFAADNAARQGAVRRPGAAEKQARLKELGEQLAAPGVGFGALFELWEHLAKSDVTLGETLARLSSDRGRQESQLDEFVTLADEFLTQTGAFVTQQHSAVVDSASGVGSTVASIQQAIVEMRRLLDAAKGDAQ